jgi:hypothetical protein
VREENSMTINNEHGGSRNGSRNMLSGDVSSHRGGTTKENQSRSKLSGFDQSTIPLIINEMVDNNTMPATRTRSPMSEERYSYGANSDAEGKSQVHNNSRHVSRGGLQNVGTLNSKKPSSNFRL